MLSNTLRLSFCYLKIINILHPRYHPNKKIKYSKKEAEEHVCLHSWYYAINHTEDENVDYIDNINRRRYRRGHKYNTLKKCHI